MFSNRYARLMLVCLSALAGSSALPSSIAAQETHDDVYFDVTIRGTATATIHAYVWENPAARPWAASVLAVHGFTETGATWEPLVEAMFADPILKRRVKRVVAIDLPGHGESGIPEGLPAGTTFGDLVIEDNVSVVIQSIDALAAMDLGSRVIMGHSMGGLEVQAAQETLLAQGSSLAAHGIYGAVLIAPVPPANVAWTQGPAADLSPYVITDPELGTYLDLPAVAFLLGGGFTTLEGELVENAPSLQEIEEKGYVGIEPITTALQLVGAIPVPRPSVREGAFAPLRHGTLLSVISLSQDVLVPAMDLDELYVHLIGRPGLLYRPVDTPDAVHNMHISDPAGMIAALRKMF